MGNDTEFTLTGKFRDDITAGLRDVSGGYENIRESVGRLGPAERAWNSEIQQVRSSILEQRDALVLRKEALDDPAMQRAIKESRDLQAEIHQLTKAELAQGEAVGITTRQRRELIVAMREIGRGNFTQLSGTAMVLEEGKGGISGALSAAIAMLGGPYVVAVGAAALATVGVSVALWKASEAAEKNYHTLKLQGEELGVSTDAMLGFQNLVVGTNVSTEELTRAFGMFEKRIGANSEKFRELGITARDPLAAFEQIMDKVRGMSDAEERAAFVTEALGRGGEKLIPVLMEGGDAAKRAIEAMKIPDDVKADFDKTAADQIEIDKNWMIIKQHTGEAAAGVWAYFKDIEDGILRTIADKGGVMSGLQSYLMYGSDQKAPVKKDTSLAALQSQYGDKGMTDEQSKWLKKQGSKDSLKAELASIHDEYVEKAAGLAEESDGYKAFMRQEEQAEDDEKVKWAKAHRGAKGKEDRTPGEADSEFEKATGISYGAYSMAHPGGTEADTAGQGASVTKGEQGDEAKAKAKMLADLTKSQEDKSRLEQREVDQFGKWEANKTRIAQQEAAKRQAAEQKYFDAAQKGMEQQILLMEQGKFSAKELDTVFENMAEQAVARLISETVVSLAQSVIMGTAWAGPAMLASIATSGGADAAGSAGYEAAMMQAQFSGGHAKGGFGFGGSYPVGERGPEMANPVTPVQYTPASLTNNYHSGGNSIVVHIHGGDLNAIQRTIRNATTNGAQSSR